MRARRWYKSSAVGSPARTSALPARAPDSPGSAAGFGASSPASSARSGRRSSSSRTSRPSEGGGSIASWKILPAAGSMRNGAVFARTRSAPRTGENGSSFWPTPAATPYGSSQNGSNSDRPSAGTPSLENMARASAWPTPRARDWRGAGKDCLDTAATMWQTPRASDGEKGSPNQALKGKPSLTAQATRSLWPTPTAGDAKSSGARNLTGSKAHPGVSLTDAVLTGTSTVSRRDPGASPSGMVLNPRFVEALMGFKDGWTDSAVWEMPLFRRLQR